MAPSGQQTRSSTLSAIKDFTLLCVIKREVSLVALQSKALQLSGLEDTYIHADICADIHALKWMVEKNIRFIYA